MKNAVTFSEFVKYFGCQTTFGPLWDNPSYVMDCLKKYLANEEHNADGWKVDRLAYHFMCNPYEASGEEINAVACLLKHNCGETVIPA